MAGVSEVVPCAVAVASMAGAVSTAAVATAAAEGKSKPDFGVRWCWKGRRLEPPAFSFFRRQPDPNQTPSKITEERGFLGR